MKNIYVILALVVLTVAVLGEARPARARLGPDAVLWQTRSCTGEIGWDDTESCVAMTYVHLARAELGSGSSLAYMARNYSRAIRDPRRAWVLQLTLDARRPTGLRNWTHPRVTEEGDTLRSRRDGWLAMLAAVRGAVDGSIPNPCPGALHYGSKRLDANNLNPDRWEPATCLPDSGQRFYNRRSR